jgi:tripartite-type tricarboxylate transporter receptor subunit TctC
MIGGIMNWKLVRKISASLLLCALAGIPTSGLKAQNATLGKSVRFIIGYEPAGGYDTYSRLFAQHLGDHLPGNPSVVAQNMPGAQSIRAARYLYFQAPKDGSVIGMIDQAMYLSKQLGESNINFDVQKFNWIGRLTNNTPIKFTWYESPIKSRKDFFTKKVVLFGAASASLDYIFLKKLMGANIQIINDYKGTNNAMLAMQQGEISGLEMPSPVLLAKYGALVKENKIIPLFQAGPEKDPALSAVPRMIDVAKTEHDRKLFEFLAQGSGIGRSVIAPPALPPAVLATLRKGFTDTVHDPKFLSDVKRARLTLAVLDGSKLADLVKRDGEYPKEVVQEAAAIAKGSGLIH